jgi:hypothetical protein
VILAAFIVSDDRPAKNILQGHPGSLTHKIRV